MRGPVLHHRALLIRLQVIPYRLGPMRRVDQDTFGQPEGNCWTACLCSILELELDDLKDVQNAHAEQARRYLDGVEWSWDPILEVLHPHGVTLVFFPDHLPPKGYSLASGPSPRGIQHSCVARDGVVVHDPHPSRAGLREIEGYTALVPIVVREKSQ